MDYFPGLPNSNEVSSASENPRISRDPPAVVSYQEKPRPCSVCRKMVSGKELKRVDGEDYCIRHAPDM